MTLDEVSSLVREVQEFPIDKIKEIENEANRLNVLVKYTRHSKRLERYSKKLTILKQFQMAHSIFTNKQ